MVCTTEFAQAECRRIAAPDVAMVPLGVDLELFDPHRHDHGLRADLGSPGPPLLVHCGRLSVEKRAERSIEAVADVLARPPVQRREAARQRAEQFTWPAAVTGMPAVLRR